MQVDLIGDFIYDAAADRFLDADGHEVTPESMLDRAYRAHCRTLRARFVWRWNAASFIRWVGRQSVGGGQDLCMWLLLNWYDVQLALQQEKVTRFHRFRFADFKAVSDVHGKGDTFFGFHVARKNLVTNVFVLAVVCVVIYRYAPRGGLLTAIYGNDVLTTGALIVGFLAADILGPLLLKAIIVVLSRFREAVMFFTIKVSP